MTKFGDLYLMFFSILICFLILYFFTLLKVDTKAYAKYLLKSEEILNNAALAALVNANTLSNLPNINIDTNNDDVAEMIKCKDSAILMDKTIDPNKNYTQLCKNKCGANGSVVLLQKGQEYFFNNVALAEGAWCVLNSIPCNLNTGYVVATVNSNICKSKYPSMFGGADAGTIIACNNEKYPATSSKLWDYANNEEVDPQLVIMTHEDEKLTDGQFRFRCKYNETDNGNPYMAHPLNRFHPLRDLCTESVYRAPYEAHAVVSDSSWYCECGVFEDTRIKHLDPKNIKSTCTSCYYEKDKNTYRIPYRCFTMDSHFIKPTQLPPCLNNFLNPGNKCDTITLNIEEHVTENPIAMMQNSVGAEERPFLGIEFPTDMNTTILNYRYNVRDV